MVCYHQYPLLKASNLVRLYFDSHAYNFIFRKKNEGIHGLGYPSEVGLKAVSALVFKGQFDVA